MGLTRCYKTKGFLHLFQVEEVVPHQSFLHR